MYVFYVSIYSFDPCLVVIPFHCVPSPKFPFLPFDFNKPQISKFFLTVLYVLYIY